MSKLSSRLCQGFAQHLTTILLCCSLFSPCDSAAGWLCSILLSPSTRHETGGGTHMEQRITLKFLAKLAHTKHAAKHHTCALCWHKKKDLCHVHVWPYMAYLWPTFLVLFGSVCMLVMDVSLC